MRNLTLDVFACQDFAPVEEIGSDYRDLDELHMHHKSHKCLKTRYTSFRPKYATILIVYCIPLSPRNRLIFNPLTHTDDSRAATESAYYLKCFFMHRQCLVTKMMYTDVHRMTDDPLV